MEIELDEAQADPASASKLAVTLEDVIYLVVLIVSHQVTLSLRITTASNFQTSQPNQITFLDKCKLIFCPSSFSTSLPRSMASLLSSNPTLASNPSYSFSQALHNSAAGSKEHAFYPYDLLRYR